MSEKLFIYAKEVAEDLEVSMSKAYKLIHAWNEELAAKGYTTVRGRVSRQYYLERMYGLADQKEG